MSVRYFVVLHRGEWMVEVEGTHYGPYPSQSSAIAAALTAAAGLAEAEVLATSSDSRLERFIPHQPDAR